MDGKSVTIANGSPELSALAARREDVSMLIASMIAARYRAIITRCRFTGRLGYPFETQTNTFLGLQSGSLAFWRPILILGCMSTSAISSHVSPQVGNAGKPSRTLRLTRQRCST